MAKVNWSLPIRIEHQVQRIINQQEINGWYFNTEKAEEYIAYLKKEQEKIYEKVRPMLKPEVLHTRAEVSKPFTKQGQLISRLAAWYGNSLNSNNVSGPLCLVEFLEPDIGKRGRLMRQLSFHGWKALEFTDKGNPRLTEESMEMLGGIGKDISKWYIYRHRCSQIEGWLKHVRNDHRITASANTCGTNTGRMRHSVVVNVPKAKKKVTFGREMRSLFTVPKGKVLIGHDAAGLEARMMAHYLNDKELTDLIIHPDKDFHADAVGATISEFTEDDRDVNKTVGYAYIYGAGDAKLGSNATRRPKGWSDSRIGKQMRTNIAKGIPALGELSDRVKAQAKRGFLVGLDGRKMPVRSEHSALNVLFQGAGAIVMKMSMILLDDWVHRDGLDVLKVGDFHDEGQAEVIDNKESIELYSYFAVQSIIEAGKFFKLRCPLDAEAIVGQSWAETH